MFSWLTNPNILLGGLILALLQVIAALPWLRAIDPRGFDKTLKNPAALGSALLPILLLCALAAWFLGYLGESSHIETYGKYYGAILHLQLLIDLFIIVPLLLTVVWPKGGAVALAAYREGWRQPLFWLLLVVGGMAIMIAVIFPYFTFGDDYKMMKQIGFDIIMLAAVLFGVLAASISISEEIEGRTAITVMSKPINRRSFLLGKFVGILMACVGMSLLLGWVLNFALWAMPEFDPINKDRAFDAMPAQAKEFMIPAFESIFPTGAARTMATGAGAWFGDAFAHTFGILLGFGQVMILVAIATALATRLPFVANVVVCLSVYFLGHLAPVVVKETGKMQDGGAGVGLIRFLGDLFDTLLPALEFFNMGPAIIRETPLDLWQFAAYVLTLSVYAVIYTAIALIVGLFLFEDRDLA